jgi:hypothetical protein
VRFKSSPQPSSFTSSKPYDAAAAADFSITARTASEFGDPVYRSRQMQLFRYLLSPFHLCPWAPRADPKTRELASRNPEAHAQTRAQTRAHTLACAHTRVLTHRHAHARDNEVDNNFDSHHRDNNLIAHTKAVRHRHSGGSSSGRYQPAFRPR